MKKFILYITLVLSLSWTCSHAPIVTPVIAQSSTQLVGRCAIPNQSLYGNLGILASGDISFFPCPTRSSIFNGNVDFSGATVIGIPGVTLPLTTKGDLLGFTSVPARFGIGSNGQVLSADSTQVTGLNWVTPTGGTVSTNYYSSVTSLATIAAVTSPAIYILNSSVTVGANTILPKNIAVFWATSGQFVKSGAFTLTINGQVIAPRVQVFNGFTNTTLFIKGAQEAIFPEWFGAIADYVISTGTDNAPAFQLMFDVVSFPNDYNPYGALGGGQFVFAQGSTYLCNSTIIIRKQVIIQGFGRESTTIVFAANTTGFIFEGYKTETGSYLTPQATATASQIKDIKISAVASGVTTHTVNIATNLTLTRTAGANFDGNNGYGENQSITIGNSEWLIYGGSSAPPVTASSLQLAVKPFYLVAGDSDHTKIYVSNSSEVESWWTGMTLNFNWLDGTNHVYTITAVTGTNNFTVTPTIDASNFPAGNNFYTTATITNIVARTGVAVRFNLFHGIDSKVAVDIEHSAFTDFAGNGLNFDSIGQPNNGSEPNTNNSTIIDDQVWRNKGNGIYFRGTNSNNSTIILLDAQSNSGTGINDVSFLGNNYIGCHSANNLQGGYLTQYNGVNKSSFTGCYAEGGQPGNYIGLPAMWLGGNPGNGFISSTNGTLITSDANVGVTLTGPVYVSSGGLSVVSTTSAFSPPRMTTTQKTAIGSPTAGMVVFDLTLHKLCVYTGSTWETVTSL